MMRLLRGVVLVGVGLVVVGCVDAAVAQTRRRRNVRIPVRPVSPRAQLSEKERKENIRQWNRDLAHWRGVLRGEDVEAELRQRALFHLAVGYEQTGKTAAAVESLQKLREDFLKSSWYAEATVRLFDLKLEREADIVAARQLADVLRKWADPIWAKRAREAKEQTKEQKTEKAPGSISGLTPPARREADDSPAQRVAKPLVAKTPVHLFAPGSQRPAMTAAYRRVALLAYLEGNIGLAQLVLRKAGSGGLTSGAATIDRQTAAARPPRDAAREQVLARVSYLVRTRGVSLPTSVRKGGDKDASTLLALAGLLQRAGDIERPVAIYSRVVSAKGFEPTNVQRSYARFVRGLCYYADHDIKQRKKARGDYLAAQRMAPKEAWAADAIFLAANTWWNLDRDGDEAVKLWTKAIEDYPTHREAARAAYYIGIAYETNKRYPAARAAFEQLKSQFGDSAFAKAADEHLKELARK